MVQNKCNSCPNFTSILVSNPIYKIKSSSNIEKLLNKKYYIYECKSYGKFLQKYPNATRKERIMAIKRFLNSVY